MESRIGPPEVERPPSAALEVELLVTIMSDVFRTYLPCLVSPGSFLLLAHWLPDIIMGITRAQAEQMADVHEIDSKIGPRSLLPSISDVSKEERAGFALTGWRKRLQISNT